MGTKANTPDAKVAGIELIVRMSKLESKSPVLQMFEYESAAKFTYLIIDLGWIRQKVFMLNLSEY